MKTKMQVLAGKGIVRFGLGVVLMASLSFAALSTATAQPIMGKTPRQLVGCGDVCQSRLYLCLIKGGNQTTCLYNYGLCESGCNTGARVPAPTE